MSKVAQLGGVCSVGKLGPRERSEHRVRRCCGEGADVHMHSGRGLAPGQVALGSLVTTPDVPLSDSASQARVGTISLNETALALTGLQAPLRGHGVWVPGWPRDAGQPVHLRPPGWRGAMVGTCHSQGVLRLCWWLWPCLSCAGTWVPLIPAELPCPVGVGLLPGGEFQRDSGSST